MTENTKQTEFRPDEQNSPREASYTAPSEEIVEYVISWKWLLGGVIALLLTAGIIGGIYLLRSSGLSMHVLDVARTMQKEAEALKSEADAATDPAVKTEKFLESIKIREDAANLLQSYEANQPPAQSNIDVLRLLNELLESLYRDQPGPARIAKLLENCSKIIQVNASDSESLPYLQRQMELEWERRRDMAVILDRAQTVYRIENQLYNRENYRALRIITMVALGRLSATGYNPMMLPIQNPPGSMDQLLERVYNAKPDDVEIAFRYAQFIADVDRPEFRSASSQELLAMNRDERLEKAMGIMNDMASRNTTNPQAFFFRYLFRLQYRDVHPEANPIDSDLETILKLDPNHPEGLILSGNYALMQMSLALSQNDKEKAEACKKEAENYYKRVVSANPHNGTGYQYLGDFYVRDSNMEEAIKIWSEGVQKARPRGNQELIGRVVVALTDRKRFEEARTYIEQLSIAIQERRIVEPTAVRQLRSMESMLLARLHAAEGTEAYSKAEQAQASGQAEEARRLFKLALDKTSDANQKLDQLFRSFETLQSDFLRVEDNSVYANLLPESLMLAGRLKSDTAQWHRAAFYFEAASTFNKYRFNGVVAAANAFQQQNLPDRAVSLLGNAVDQDPNNMILRFIYTQTRFRMQSSRSTTTVQDLAPIEENLKFLQEHRNQIPDPWAIDLRLVQLDMLRESLSNDPERILAAQAAALRRYQELESAEFPPGPDRDAPPRRYSDDLNFLRELAGAYSNLAALADFDRILERMRELPGGEVYYFDERINDALRRNDVEGAIIIIEEALNSDLLDTSNKHRYIALMEGLKTDEIPTLDAVYERLKTTFDQSPDSMKLQGYFLLANLCIDRNDLTRAKRVQELIQRIEGRELGYMWRYIAARILMLSPESNVDEIRNLQNEIITLSPDWDMGYVLISMTEEEALLRTQDNAEIKKKLIQTYQEAIRCGNRQPVLWNRLLSLLDETGETQKAQELKRNALVYNVQLEATPGQFPQPYNRMFERTSLLIQEEKPDEADVVARQCLSLARGRRAEADLIFSLNLAFGKVFMDAGYTQYAERHLNEVARRGGTYVYPLAVCYAKAQKIDEGVNLLLDEMRRMPSSMGTLLPSLLILLSQLQNTQDWPSEEVMQKIDQLMNRIENGERLTLRAEMNEPDYVPMGTRRIYSMSVLFPDNETTPPADSIILYPPEDDEEEDEDAEQNEE